MIWHIYKRILKRKTIMGKKKNSHLKKKKKERKNEKERSPDPFVI